MTDTSRIYRLRPRTVVVSVVLADFLFVGMGMGIPILNIAFGFIVGWYLMRWISVGTREPGEMLRSLLKYSCISAGVTFLGMAVIWGWSVKMLFDPHADIVDFGIPMILFEPRMSLIGWLALMIVISPFLQLLTTVFAGDLTFLWLYRRESKDDVSNKGSRPIVL